MSKLVKNDCGHATWTEKGTDKILLCVGTLQCVHCGGHFPAKPSKGRGFCWRCAGPICGAGCLECVPEEQLLENYEKGHAENFRKIIIAT